MNAAMPENSKINPVIIAAIFAVAAAVSTFFLTDSEKCELYQQIDSADPPEWSG